MVRPRLADAKFFFDQDRKQHARRRASPGSTRSSTTTSSAARASASSGCARSRALASPSGIGADARRQADRAALLAKADLLTDMVGEFPELQGIMGALLRAPRRRGRRGRARRSSEHYQPRFAGDALPRNPVGDAASRSPTSSRRWSASVGIGQLPTGDKDPFALRRHALGVVRILIERRRRCRSTRRSTLRDAARAGRSDVRPRALADDAVGRARVVRLRAPARLARERGYGAARDRRGARRASPAARTTSPPRLVAVRAFAALPEAPALAAANKRIGNILKKSDAAAGARSMPALLRRARRAGARTPRSRDVGAARRRGASTAATTPASLRALAGAASAPVDAFFDDVMVKADDAGAARQPARAAGAAARGDEPRRRPVAAGRLTAQNRGDEARHPRPRRHDQPGQRRLHQVARRVGADARRARSDRAAEPRRLAHGGRDQPVGPRRAACSTWRRSTRSTRG